ncbi:MAG TPA: MlaD family protein [Acidimicrobiales bacterium]|nr:MlaD family protein [Acidimicrobiales bacterium]
MITRRVAINLGAFLLVAAVLVFFGIVNLLGNPFSARTQLRAVFPDASGLSPNFDVTYDGVAVGSVSGVKLVHNGVLVTMALDPGLSVPGDVVADVDLANALGEQQIDLVPAHGGTAPPLRNGATVPVDPNGIPASVGQLVSVATKLLNAIPPGDLNSVLHQLAVALNGHGQDLRTINDESRVFAQEFLAYQSQFEALLANAPPVLNAVSAVGPQLRQALANTAVLAQVLANRRSDLANAIDQGSAVAADLNTLLASQLPNLACLTHDFADLTANLDEPANLANLNTALLTNGYFFGAVDDVSPPGRAVSLYPGDPTRDDQFWLRTRLLFPPSQPQASEYSTPKGLPPTKPGAGCSTEFGNGVGPASQAHPSPPGLGGRLIAPTAAEAVVRGGEPQPAGETAVFRVPAAGTASGDTWLITVLLGLGVVGGGLWLAGLSVPIDPAGRDRRWPRSRA